MVLSPVLPKNAFDSNISMFVLHELTPHQTNFVPLLYLEDRSTSLIPRQTVLLSEGNLYRAVKNNLRKENQGLSSSRFSARNH